MSRAARTTNTKANRPSGRELIRLISGHFRLGMPRERWSSTRGFPMGDENGTELLSTDLSKVHDLRGVVFC
jgi:hypothetical protein